MASRAAMQATRRSGRGRKRSAAAAGDENQPANRARGSSHSRSSARVKNETSTASSQQLQQPKGQGSLPAVDTAGLLLSSGLEAEPSMNYEFRGRDSKMDFEVEPYFTVTEREESRIQELLGADMREELFGRLVRYLLLKNARRQQCTRNDINKEVIGPDGRGVRGLAKYLLLKANNYLQQTFGFVLVDGAMVDEKYAGTIYIMSDICKFRYEATHMEAHIRGVSVGTGERVEVAKKALLLATLAVALHAGDGGVAEPVLYDQLQKVDENIKPGKHRYSNISETIDVPYEKLLAEWTSSKYLVKEKQDFHGDMVDFYTLGPRAYAEVCPFPKPRILAQALALALTLTLPQP
mmetsp:Transcript_31437/g.99692  ORF Transcript_31437/g.99692 Transcript_31437/m.99692 type:complete len:351 (-) Transcript_31437:438-1490(-)